MHHADFYRIGDQDDLYGTGFFDLVGGNGALLVEWADRIPDALPSSRLELELAHDDQHPSHRRIEIRGWGERHANLARLLVGRFKA